MNGRPLPDWVKAEPIGQDGHHSIFGRFERTRPFDEAGHHVNFMGARIAHAFERDLRDAVPSLDPAIAGGLKASGRSIAVDDDPTFPHRNSEDYFEWIDLLTAIDRADTSFTMIELGAGYGRWTANAAAALKRRRGQGALRQTLIALEANKDRFEMMIRNCAENGIPAADIQLIRAACTPDGSPVLMICNDDYGTGVIKDETVLALFDQAGSDRITVREQDGRVLEVEKVPALRLDSLLAEPVDFIDFDIQGAELEVIFAGIDAMDRFVKMAHVGTHSMQIDSRLAHLFHLHGWLPRRMFSCGSVNRTPYGEFPFIDGIQSWENPRFEVRR